MSVDAEPESAPKESSLRRLPIGTIALWLVVLSLVVFFVPLYLVSAGILSDVGRLRSELSPVQATLTSMAKPAPDTQEKLKTLAHMQSLSAAARTAVASTAANHTDWPALISCISRYDPRQIMLTSLTEADNLITLRGRAINDPAVVAYARALEECKLFSRVVVQSIRSVETPFATATILPTSATPQAASTSMTPTVTLTPTATITPTPDPRDAYEVDDVEPKDIAFDQPQAHNFYPAGDVDKVKFLAKAGRYYRVFTSELQPGVDTSLTVWMDGIVYRNDDRQPGDLSSEILFRAPLGRDLWVIVEVLNRGQYGPDKWYNLTAQEILPTPTASPAVSPTPTPTATATATPDLRDAFEPDDEPKPIVLGQPQTHNFYPPGDVDRVKFLAKAGRYYRVYTTNLAPGVDTALTIWVGGATYTNDDRPGHDPNDHSSEITFFVGSSNDLEAIVNVMNRGQDGPDKTYLLVAEEIAPTPVPTLTATPDLRDNYEPDDHDPPPDIFFGQPQLHNFYPSNDIDRVRFLAKAGHFYRVSTSGLATGVDTILTVAVGSVVYTSDDRHAGDLSSEVLFGNSSGADVYAIVEVRNRGAFGSDKLYTLTAEELSDIYEPDDVTPRPIAVGETQTHSFYPQADIDRVVFLAKAGRWYRVFTSGLTAGVDTLLTVTLTSGGTVYGSFVNDDRTLGDPSSWIEFRNGAGSDVDAVVEIANRGQFAPDKRYQITVEEFTPPTPTPGPRPPRASRGLGLAAMRSDLSLMAAFQPVHRLYADEDRVISAWNGEDKRILEAPAKAVEFVIVLELKAKPR